MSVYDNLIIQDPLEVIIFDGTDAKFFGCTTEGNVTQTVDQTEIVCGIGGKVKAILNDKKTITFSVTSAMHNSEFLALNSGTSFTSASFNIWKNEKIIGVEDTSTVTVTYTGTPVDDTVYVNDIYGNKMAFTAAAKVLTITSGVAGDYYNVIYQEATTAEQLDLNSASFPTSTQVQLHTIAYDEIGDEIIADIYWNFPAAMADGAIDESYSGDAKTSSIGFKVVDDGSGSYGTYMVVERATT